nr:hypothetical protein [Tanacetum cinerariifolium]
MILSPLNILYRDPTVLDSFLIPWEAGCWLVDIVLGMTGDEPLVFDEQRVLDNIVVGPLVLQMITGMMEVNRIVEQLVITLVDTESDCCSMKESYTS